MKIMIINKISLCLFISVLFLYCQSKNISFVYQSILPSTITQSSFQYYFSIGRTIKNHYITKLSFLPLNYNSTFISSISNSYIDNIRAINSVLIGLYDNANTEIELTSSSSSVYYKDIDKDIKGKTIKTTFFDIKPYTKHNKTIFAMSNLCPSSNFAVSSSTTIRYLIEKFDLIVNNQYMESYRYLMNAGDYNDTMAVVHLLYKAFKGTDTYSTKISFILELSEENNTFYINAFNGEETIISNMKYINFKEKIKSYLKSSEEIQSLCVLPLTSSSYSLNSLGIQPSPIGYVISICLLIVSIALLGILLHHQITDLVALKRDYIDFSSSSNEERWEEEIVENNLICTENNSISIF